MISLFLLLEFEDLNEDIEGIVRDGALRRPAVFVLGVIVTQI